MFRSVVILVALVGLISGQAYDDGDKEVMYKCSAWGDPHVTRFPNSEVEQPGEVWCQQSGWQTLIKNNYVNGRIYVSETPYTINRFKFELFNADRSKLCTITEDVFTSALEDCGEDVSVSKDGDMLTISHGKEIKIIIKKYTKSDNPRDFYTIEVYQSSPMVNESHGICKTSCDPVTGKLLQKRALPDNLSNSNKNAIKQNAEKICETLISKLVPKFKISSLKQMDLVTKNTFTACKTDVGLTGDISFAKAGVEHLAINIATKDLTINSNFKDMKKDIIDLIDKTNALMDKEKLDFANPSTSSDDFSVMVNENERALLSCRKTWSSVIKVVSAIYESRTSSCSVDVTDRVKQLCAKTPRSCQFTASNTVLEKEPCDTESQKLKIKYLCQ